MKGDFLDHKVDFKFCGTIYLAIPDDARENTPIHCSTCNRYLGTWGELQDDCIGQTVGTDGIVELKDGRIKEK